jgi:hypothetical protein
MIVFDENGVKKLIAFLISSTVINQTINININIINRQFKYAAWLNI